MQLIVNTRYDKSEFHLNKIANSLFSNLCKNSLVAPLLATEKHLSASKLVQAVTKMVAPMDMGMETVISSRGNVDRPGNQLHGSAMIVEDVMITVKVQAHHLPGLLVAVEEMTMADTASEVVATVDLLAALHHGNDRMMHLHLPADSKITDTVGIQVVGMEMLLAATVNRVWELLQDLVVDQADWVLLQD